MQVEQKAGKQMKPRTKVQAVVRNPKRARVAGRANAAAVTKRSVGGTAVTGTAAGSAAGTGMLTETGGTGNASPGAYTCHTAKRRLLRIS